MLVFICQAAPALADGASLAQVGVTEMTGGYIPSGLVFQDESGRQVALGDLFKRPVIMTLSYYGCSGLCPRFLGALSAVLGKVNAVAAQDYSVITVSIDEKDTPERAAQRKRDHIKAVGKPFPDDGWRFLSGGRESIHALASSTGYEFRREAEGFSHPSALVVVSAKGRIIRYINGESFLPAEIDMAIKEAADDRPVPTIPKALLFCYRQDPASRAMVLSIMKAAGVLVLLSAAIFLIYLTSGAGRDLR